MAADRSDARAALHGPAQKVAVLGTGIMGAAMTRNLAAAGLRTTVWGRSADAAAALAPGGVIPAASPQEALRAAEAVITMLPTGEVTESVMFAAACRRHSPPGRRGRRWEPSESKRLPG